MPDDTQQNLAQARYEDAWARYTEKTKSAESALRSFDRVRRFKADTQYSYIASLERLQQVYYLFFNTTCLGQFNNLVDLVDKIQQHRSQNEHLPNNP